MEYVISIMEYVISIMEYVISIKSYGVCDLYQVCQVSRESHVFEVFTLHCPLNHALKN